MDREARLQALLPVFLEKTPTEAESDDALLAYVRVYASLCRLAVIHGGGEPFGGRAGYARRAADLFVLLVRRAGETADFVRRARIVSALFFLSGETSFSYDEGQAEACRGAALALLDDYAREERPDDLACACVCRCIADLCYPAGCGGEEWLERLAGRVERWAASLDDQGCWSDADTLLAFERIEVMNRYSYMFLDESFDAAIRRAYGYYAGRMAELLGADPDQAIGAAEKTVALLCACYDAAMQGNAYAVDRAVTDRVAACLERMAEGVGDRSSVEVAGIRLRALAVAADNLCERIIDQQQRGMMES